MRISEGEIEGLQFAVGAALLALDDAVIFVDSGSETQVAEALEELRASLGEVQDTLRDLVMGRVVEVEAGRMNELARFLALSLGLVRLAWDAFGQGLGRERLRGYLGLSRANLEEMRQQLAMLRYTGRPDELAEALAPKRLRRVK